MVGGWWRSPAVEGGPLGGGDGCERGDEQGQSQPSQPSVSALLRTDVRSLYEQCGIVICY